MANKKPKLENLTSFNKMDKEKHREISVKGAEASNKKQAEDKQLKNALLMLLSSKDIEAQEEQTNLVSACVAIIKKAKNGDVPAWLAIRDTIGEKPTDKVEQTNIDTTPFEVKIVK